MNSVSIWKIRQQIGWGRECSGDLSKECRDHGFEQWPDLQGFWLQGCVLLAYSFPVLRPLWRARGSARHFITEIFLEKNLYSCLNLYHLIWVLLTLWREVRKGRFVLGSDIISECKSCKHQYCLSRCAWCWEICIQGVMYPGKAVTPHLCSWKQTSGENFLHEL